MRIQTYIPGVLNGELNNIEREFLRECLQQHIDEFEGRCMDNLTLLLIENGIVAGFLRGYGLLRNS